MQAPIDCKVKDHTSLHTACSFPRRQEAPLSFQNSVKLNDKDDCQVLNHTDIARRAMHKRDLPFAIGTVVVALFSVIVWRDLPAPRLPSSTRSNDTVSASHSTSKSLDNLQTTFGRQDDVRYIAGDMEVESVLHKYQDDFQLKVYARDSSNRQLSPDRFEASLEMACPASFGGEETITLSDTAADDDARSGSLSLNMLQSCRITLLAYHELHSHRWLLHNHLEVR